ncbi:MAG TPA: calcium-binding protein, partial [Allosphingosinicella sp.]
MGGNDVLNGHDGYDTLYGGDGDDRLDGGLGIDFMRGGAGNDVYIVGIGDGARYRSGYTNYYSTIDPVTELASEGIDEIQTDLRYFSLARTSWYVLKRELGVDNRNGGPIGAYNPGAVENLTGTSDSGQILLGNHYDNIIAAGAGNDTLDGAEGQDTLSGGRGDDRYFVGDGDTIVEDADEGVDQVTSSAASFTLFDNLENLTGGLDTGQILIGNSSANVITGGAGDDILDGGAGADTMTGGQGHDTYHVDHEGDVVSEIGGGLNTLYTIFTHRLSDIFQNLYLRGTDAIDGFGNDFGNKIAGNVAANVIVGYLGDDELFGGGGADQLLAGEGDDFLAGHDGDDRLVGGAGMDVLRGGGDDDGLSGGAGNDQLEGNDGNDQIDAGAGDDIVEGGAADDLLDGSTGTDTASYAAARQAVLVSLSIAIGQDTVGAGIDTLKG